MAGLIYPTGISNPLTSSFRFLGTAWCPASCRAIMPSSLISDSDKQKKLVWIWTESKEVMTASVERGWDTFIFPSEPRFRDLAAEWSSIALIHPLFIEGAEISNIENQIVARFYAVSSPEDLVLIQPHEQTNDLVINFKAEWQIIPAENLVAAFQGCKRTVLAVTTTSFGAQGFLEALEQGLGGVVLKADDIGEIFALNNYFDRQNEVRNLLSLTKATVTHVEVVGMGDRVCIDLCSLMRPVTTCLSLVGSFARGLFLVHSECLESNYIASRPFRVNAGPVHGYVAVPGGKTCYLSELQAGRQVIVVDRSGKQRNAIVGRVKIESRPLILVEVKEDSSNETYSIFLQNAETVGLVCPCEDKSAKTVIPVTSLKVRDEILLRVQGGARHTGIEIQEFILER